MDQLVRFFKIHVINRANSCHFSQFEWVVQWSACQKYRSLSIHPLRGHSSFQKDCPRFRSVIRETVLTRKGDYSFFAQSSCDSQCWINGIAITESWVSLSRIIKITFCACCHASVKRWSMKCGERIEFRLFIINILKKYCHYKINYSRKAWKLLYMLNVFFSVKRRLLAIW